MFGGKTRFLFFVNQFKKVEERIWEGKMKSSLEKVHYFLYLQDSEILWIILALKQYILILVVPVNVNFTSNMQ